jgi:hypothetical protein
MKNAPYLGFLLFMTLTHAASDDLLLSLISFNKSLQDLANRVELVNRGRLRRPSSKWSSKINYPDSVIDFLAQITIRPFAKRKTKDIETDIKDLQKRLPHKFSLENAATKPESFIIQFNDVLERYRKLLFAYHYREDKNIVLEENFERLYFAALKMYNAFMTKRTEVLDPEKVIKSVVADLTAQLNEFNKSLESVMKLKDWDKSGLEYLASYLAEIQHIRSKIERSQKKFIDTVKTNEFENLLNKVHLNELKIKNEQMRLLGLRKPQKHEETLQSIMESRRKYIEDDLGEDEDSDWLD